MVSMWFPGVEPPGVRCPGRRRVLTGMGWTVVSVPFFDYYVLRTLDKKARARQPLAAPPTWL